MYIAPDDAKTDVILAAVTVVLGVSLRALVAGLPLYPRVGLLGALLDVAWVLVLTSLVPLLLARYRGDGREAFGLHGGAGAWRPGMLIAVPVVALGLALAWLADLPLLLGRAGMSVTGSGPVINIALGLLHVAAASLGTTLLFGFLAVRAREGFPRSPPMSLTQLVRTTGLAVAGLVAVAGLLHALAGGSFPVLGLHLAAVIAVLLLLDRSLPLAGALPRATLIGPAIVVVVAHVFGTGGIFSRGLPSGLYTGGLGVAVMLAVAIGAVTRRGVVFAVPAVLVAHWWPTCLSPLAFVQGVC